MAKIKCKMAYYEQIRRIDKNFDRKRIFIECSFAERYHPLRDNEHKDYRYHGKAEDNEMSN